MRKMLAGSTLGYSNFGGVSVLGHTFAMEHPETSALEQAGHFVSDLPAPEGTRCFSANRIDHVTGGAVLRDVGEQQSSAGTQYAVEFRNTAWHVVGRQKLEKIAVEENVKGRVSKGHASRIHCLQRKAPA